MKLLYVAIFRLIRINIKFYCDTLMGNTIIWGVYKWGNTVQILSNWAAKREAMVGTLCYVKHFEELCCFVFV